MTLEEKSLDKKLNSTNPRSIDCLETTFETTDTLTDNNRRKEIFYDTLEITFAIRYRTYSIVQRRNRVESEHIERLSVFQSPTEEQFGV